MGAWTMNRAALAAGPLVAVLVLVSTARCSSAAEPTVGELVSALRQKEGFAVVQLKIGEYAATGVDPVVTREHLARWKLKESAIAIFQHGGMLLFLIHDENRRHMSYLAGEFPAGLWRSSQIDRDGTVRVLTNYQSRYFDQPSYDAITRGLRKLWAERTSKPF
jgi:hypothetical protein